MENEGIVHSTIILIRAFGAHIHFPFSIFQLQNRSRAIILLLGDGLDHNSIAVALFGGDIHPVTDLFAEHRLTERCLAADSAVQRITPHGRYHLNGIRVIIVLSSSTLSNRPTSSAPALSSITCADLIMRSR